MKIVKLKGGLGNQMFQYAFAKLLEQRTGECVKIDLSAYSTNQDDLIRRPRILKFNIDIPIATQNDIKETCLFHHENDVRSKWYKVSVALEVLLNKKYYFERNRAYVAPEQILDKVYFDGYWQSWRYIDEVWRILKDTFVPKELLSDQTNCILAEIKNQNSVFIGIRRGDYQKKLKHYGMLEDRYYYRAMRYICERIPNAVFYIFSNDIEWVKKNMDFSDYHVIFRDDEQNIDDFEELILMMNCKHSIIANSTYHWWGARMYDNKEKIVIAPERWFFDDKPSDIVPEHWIRM